MMIRETIFEKQTVTGFTFSETRGAYQANINPAPFIAVVGNVYEIYWDGNTYICEAQDLTALGAHVGIGDFSSFGGTGNGEPFAIGSSSYGVSIFTMDSAESHVIGVYEYAETEEPQGITLRNYHGETVVHEDIETLSVNNTEGGIDTFTRGIAIEDVPISLDFSDGDQIVTATDGYLVKSAIIEKPETLIAANIADGIDIAGIIGTHKGGGGGTENEDTTSNEEPWIDDVCFWDLEGNLIRNVPMNQIQNLVELPNAPVYDNMVFEGWNYTLEDIKATEHPLDIAPTYSTADGKTHIKLTPTGTSYLDFKFNFTQTVENGVSIDFGDGSAPQTVSGTGAVSITHTFASVQEYEMVISVSDGCILGLGGGAKSTPFATKSTATNYSDNYGKAITDMMIADGVELNQYCIHRFFLLKFVSLPKTITSLSYVFYQTGSVPCVSIPNGVKEIDGNVAYYFNQVNYGPITWPVISFPPSIELLGHITSMHWLRRLVIPDSVKSIGVIGSNYKLKRLFLSNNITSIGNSFLANSYSIERFSFPKNITSIGDSFLYSGSKIKSVIIPPTVTSIGTSFASQSGIEEVYIPSSVTSIGGSWLNQCLGFKRVIIEDGSKLQSCGGIDRSYTAHGMETIYLSPNPPTKTIFEALTHYSYSCTVYVPDEAVEAYRNVPSSLYKNIILPLSEYHGKIPNYNK